MVSNSTVPDEPLAHGSGHAPGRRARVVYWSNGGGLSRSAQLVARSLRAAGWQVELANNAEWLIAEPGWSARYVRVRQSAHIWMRRLRNGLNGTVGPAAVRLGLRQPVDLNIFLEHLVPTQYHRARRNVWIPNQEWMPRAWRSHLQELKPAHLEPLDAIWVKTRYAESLFRPLSPRVQFVGFTSFDVLDPAVVKQPHTFLHVAGRSRLKGTAAVIEAWRRNPSWPTLVLIESPLFAREVQVPNIDYRAVRLPDAELRPLQNRTEFHLYPSEAEGFGHALCEAMGLGGIVLTTDAPPMNELVAAERGLLVAYDRTSRQGLGTNYHVSATAIEAAVSRALALSDTAKQQLGARARAWFLANDRSFADTLPRAATSLVAGETRS